MKKLAQKIWAKEWVKFITPIYGEIMIMKQETGGHAYGYEKGFILIFTGICKYGIIALLVSVVMSACQ